MTQIIIFGIKLGKFHKNMIVILDNSWIHWLIVYYLLQVATVVGASVEKLKKTIKENM